MITKFIAVAAVALIAGCNTMHGAGEDMRAGKNKVQDTFSRHKNKTDQPTTGTAPETTAPGTSGAATTTSPTGSSPDTSGTGGAGSTQ